MCPMHPCVTITILENNVFYHTCSGHMITQFDLNQQVTGTKCSMDVSGAGLSGSRDGGHDCRS